MGLFLTGGDTMTIEFSCGGCQYPFKVPDSMAGKQGKCPKCGAITAIPTSSSSGLSSAPPPRPANGPASDGGFDDYEDRSAVRRKRKSGKGLKIGLAIGAVLLLVGAGVAVYFIWFATGSLSSDDLKFLPDKCVAVVSFKPADFVDSSLVKDNRKEMGLSDFEEKMKQASGFVPKDIDKVVVGTDGEAMYVIAKMNKSVKADEIKSAFGKSGDSKMEFKEESKVGSYTMYKTAAGDDGPAFCVPSSSLVVGSSKAKSLEALLKRDKKATFSSSFQTILDKADFSRTIAVAVDVKGLTKQMEGGMNMLSQLQLPGPAAGELNQGLSMLKQFGDKVDGVAGSVKIGSGVDGSGTLFCKDADTAKSFKKEADDGMEKDRKRLRDKKDQTGAKEQLEMLDSFKVSQSGNTVSGSVSISKSLIEKMKKNK